MRKLQYFPPRWSLGLILRFPFHRFGIIHEILLSSETILDVGVRDAFVMKMIRHLGFEGESIGIDIFIPNLLKSEVKKAYNHLVACDARRTPFKGRSVDVVLMFEVIEHMAKHEAIKAIESVEHIAKRYILISSPIGYFPQSELYGNPWEKHESGFMPDELRTLGFKVRGVGFRTISRTRNGAPISSPFKVMISEMASVLLWLLSFSKPELAERMVAIKRLNE